MSSLRLHIITLLIFVPMSICAQTVNFEDDFSDQDISDWSGTTADFTFISEGNNVLLQQNAASAGTSSLSIPSSNVIGYWEFFLRLDGFSPSDGNKAEIYLMSDAADFTTPINGYMLQAGENLSGDVFRLFRITAGNKDVEVLTGTTDISSGGDFRVKVTRDASGNWSLQVAEGYTGLLAQEASGTDNTYTSASHFGFVTTYTSTRTDKFAFDFKIYIPPVAVDNIALFNDSEIDIIFNKAYDPASVQTTDFTLFPGSLNPQSYSQISAESVRIGFADPIPSGVNDLNISGVDDISGSTTLADTTFQIVIFDNFVPGDIVINEFMKDPPTGTAEYVEIHNVSAKYLNLKNWQVADNGTFTTISISDTPILPYGYAVISADTSKLSSFYGSANYIQASLPPLNNGGDEVRLFDSTGVTVDSLSYTSDWAGIDVAIERRDPAAASIYLENWGDSPNPNFGTPGFPNEVSADTEAPQIMEVILQKPLTLLMVTSERLENATAENPGNYSLSLNPGAGANTPVIPSITTAIQVAADTTELTLDTEINEYDGSWNLNAADLTDIFGNNANGIFEFEFQNPFVFIDLTVINREQLLLEFSESIDPVSIQPSDFIIKGIQIDAATGISQPTGDQIQLDLTSPLLSGPSDIIINDLQSVSGWTINDDTYFEFFTFDEFSAGDVIINEFMKDPPSGATDYVELKNTSEKYLNLKDWQIGDELSLTTISGSDLILYPDSFAVVTPDTTALINIFGPAYYIQASLPNLNSTTSDQVRLLTSAGAIADSLQYETNWGGEDVSLERRDPTVSSIYKENWGNSPSTDLGTPGYLNLIEPDTEPAQLSEINLISRSQIQLIYSERIQESQAIEIFNYTLQADNSTDTGIGIQSIIYTKPDTVLLQLTMDLPSEPEGTTYQLSIENQTDLFGNISPTLTPNLFIIDYGVADSGDVFITEFMYDPSDGFTDFIELYNATDSAYNLQNWTFNDNSGNRRSLTDQQSTLLPGSRVVLAPDSTIKNSFPEIYLIVMDSRFANLNSTTADDIVIRNGDGVLIDSLTYSNTWGGNKTSLERRSVSVSPTYVENWGNSPSPKLGTPGSENLISEDLTSPDIVELNVINGTTLQVLFSERIEQTPAENIANFELFVPAEIETQVPPISFITFLEPDTVIIQFQSSLPKQDLGTTYLLTIQDQADVFGNIAGSLSQSFFLIDIQEADSGDVVINEFMYDPAIAYSEFIELYNKSNKNIDLRNWTLNDNTGTRRSIANSKAELVQGEYVVLVADSTLFDQFPDKNILVLGTAFPSLNNGSDDIVIRDQNGTLIDSLTYFSDWGGDQISLERLDPQAASIYSENWRNSPSPDLATPGKPNEITPDTDAPIIIHAFTIGTDTLCLRYNERVQSVPALDVSNYSVEPSIQIGDIIQTTGNTISIALSSKMTDGTYYSVNIQDQMDIFGNLQNTASVDIEFTQFSNALPGDVIINEILYKRLSGDSPEFVELYNQSDKNFDLTNWTFSDASNSTTIPSGTHIKSGKYLILTDTKDFTATNSLQSTDAVYLSGLPTLNDNEDIVVIKNKSGMVIDSLSYKNTWGGNTRGVSLERKDPLSASNDPNNWASSEAQTGNTAGSQSSVFEPDQDAPQIIFAKTVDNSRISLVFSEFVIPTNTTLTVNGSPLSIYDFDPNNGNQIIAGPLAASFGEALNLSITKIEDYRGNISHELSIEVSQPLTPGSIVINEILFDPIADSEDNLPDQTEYIELYNRSDHAISLEGLFIHDAPDENNEVRSIDPVSSQFKWIPSGDFVLVYAEDQSVDFANSRLAKFFEISNPTEDFKIRIDRSSLSLTSANDAIYIADSTGTAIDSVFYDESWHNPNLFDTDGVALERIDPNGPSNDKTNWSSSTRVNGGTPAQKNSIYQIPGSLPDETGLTFTPNPFSPDNDGFEDYLFINYKLDESDYMLRVRIFDRYGRQVKKLADGSPAGFDGSLMWDGLTDDHKKNRVGIYIILFEAYDSAKGKNKTFKKTVVLARKF
ncbi:lamin tail domain-containing protein [Gracilimonas sp. Q87]|uniref:lamin tail domain-containing protein n=1 Tax=Gracilimonas sp. Q87 TaxID=3384766 RepID=UPI003983F4D0